MICRIKPKPFWQTVIKAVISEYYYVTSYRFTKFIT